MHFKGTLLAVGLAAAVSAKSFDTQLNHPQHQLQQHNQQWEQQTQQWEQQTQQWEQHQQVGKVFKHESVQPNAEERCFSLRKVASCDDQYVASYVKHQKVGFHCINKNNPISKQYEREAEQGSSLPLENKTQDVQAYVEVPVRCERIDTEEKRLRKETEKTSEQKVHLVQQQDDEEESFLFEHRPWTKSVQEQNQEEQEGQHQQKRWENRMRSQSQNQENQQEREESSFNEEELDTMQQYGDLINTTTTMHHILSMKDEKFDRLMEHLKFIAHQNRRSDKWSQQLDQVLPNVYSKIAKETFEVLLARQTSSQQEKEELYEQYREVAKRIYAYVVKQALQMKNLNQVTSEDQQHNQQRKQFIANRIARNLWYKIQRELTQRQAEEVRQMTETIRQNQQPLDRMLNEETLVTLSKHQMRQLEKDLTKVLVAGLKMVNHNNVAQNQVQNQSEEYRRLHGEDFETELKTQYSKLQQHLSSAENKQHWN